MSFEELLSCQQSRTRPLNSPIVPPFASSVGLLSSSACADVEEERPEVKSLKAHLPEDGPLSCKPVKYQNCGSCWVLIAAHKSSVLPMRLELSGPE